MIHWCPEETTAVLTAVPALALLWRWFKGKLNQAKKSLL